MTFIPYKKRSIYLFIIVITLVQCDKDITAPVEMPAFKVIISTKANSGWVEIWSHESFSADTMSLPLSNSARSQFNNTQPDVSLGTKSSYSGALLVVAEGQVYTSEWREIIVRSSGGTVVSSWPWNTMNVRLYGFILEQAEDTTEIPTFRIYKNDGVAVTWLAELDFSVADHQFPLDNFYYLNIPSLELPDNGEPHNVSIEFNMDSDTQNRLIPMMLLKTFNPPPWGPWDNGVQGWRPNSIATTSRTSDERKLSDFQDLYFGFLSR